MDSFSVGEVAVYDFGPEDRFTGQECVVTGSLAYQREVEDQIDGGIMSGMMYPVRDSDGDWFVFPHELRKKKPPYDGNQITKWSDCPFKPREMVRV